jgi:hypothetical protein
VRLGVAGERRDDTNINSDVTNPITPAIIKITPTVDRRNPWLCTVAEL